jgi:hypothetical protein
VWLRLRRPFSLRTFDVAFALFRSLALRRLFTLRRALPLFHLPCSRLRPRFLLALDALSQLILQIARSLRLLTLLTRLIILPLPSLCTLSLALL